MQPTLEAELDGARRAVEQIASDDQLSADTVAALKNVARVLERAGRQSQKVLPYLIADTIALSGMLREISGSVPEPLQAEIASLDGQDGLPGDVRGCDVQALNRANEHLRGLVDRVVTALPPGAPGTAEPRLKIRTCLLESLEKRPW